MSAIEKSGSRERIVVDSIKRVRNSSLQISVTKKNLVFNSPFRFIQVVHTPQQNTELISLSSRFRKYEQYAYIHEVCKLAIVSIVPDNGLPMMA